MSNIEKFLTKQEELDIINAIKQAERQTSGEIRVHIESSSKIDAFDRTLELFHDLKMDNTRLQNAVLIYVAVDDRTFVIYGDKGINDIVKEDFWDSTRDVMQRYFKEGKFKRGIVEGVLKAGEQLQKHFPYTDGKNEQPDHISVGP